MSTQRTLSERDETYVGDIVRDENWLKSAPTTPRTLKAAGNPVYDWGATAERLFIESQKLETELAAERERVRVLREALESIVVSEHLDGCCPYGCDAPTIARDALAATKEDSP